MAEDTVHVIALTPSQQAVMRLALNDHFKHQADALILETYKEPNKIQQILEHLSNNFEHYEICSAGLPAPINVKFAKNKLIYLSNSAMQYMLTAVNQFSPSSAEIEDGYADVAMNVYPKLKSLVNTASKFEYTADDIKKANKSLNE
jgi:hypothetical protein